MFSLYVLKSLIVNRKYIGITENIDKRLAKHNSGSVRSTKAYRPWILVYRESYKTKREARLRELELKKSGNKRLVLFNIIECKLKERALSSIG